MSSDDQSTRLEAKLSELNLSAQRKIHAVPELRDGELKDTETALERDFSAIRDTIRALEHLAEDQE